jgi:hypothetical protein
MIEPRLAAHMLVSALRRQAEAHGGFAMVIRKGDPEAGSLMIIRREKGENPTIFEPVPGSSATREWREVVHQDIDSDEYISKYCRRLASRDPDIWIIELDVPFAQRFTDILAAIS